jgi:hypothetical protein
LVEFAKVKTRARLGMGEEFKLMEAWYVFEPLLLLLQILR